MNHCSLFSLLLSTTGKITQFPSSKDKDRSGRVVTGILLLIAPYTDLGFDQLAKKIAHDGTFTLNDITSSNWIYHQLAVFLMADDLPTTQVARQVSFCTTSATSASQLDNPLLDVLQPTQTAPPPSHHHTPKNRHRTQVSLRSL